MLKNFLIGLMLAASVVGQGFARPDEHITMQGVYPLHEVATRVAAATHQQLVFDPAVDVPVEVHVNNAGAKGVLADARSKSKAFDYYVLGNALIVGSKTFVAQYRDVVTSILPVKPGHEQAVADQLAATYKVADTTFDKNSHEVVIKVPRFLYQTMKITVARIDNSLPITATAP